MTIDDLLEDDNFGEDLTSEALDLDNIKNKIPEYTSEKLCEIIVCDRYFGCYKELSILCMEELSNRRSSGDYLFDFESYIDKSFNSLPKLDFSLPDLGDILRQSIGRKINFK